jgi:hypothetical protein
LIKKSQNTNCDSARLVDITWQNNFLIIKIPCLWFFFFIIIILSKCFRLVEDSKSLLTSLTAQLVSLKEGKSAETILLEVEDIEKHIHLHLVTKACVFYWMHNVDVKFASFIFLIFNF